GWWAVGGGVAGVRGASRFSFGVGGRWGGGGNRGPLPPLAGAGRRRLGSLPCSGGSGRCGRCTVVLACRRPWVFVLGPFEAASQIAAGALCRVTPVAAACACVSLLY